MANFEHIVRLYKSEMGKPIKFAYKLTVKIIITDRNWKNIG